MDITKGKNDWLYCGSFDLIKKSLNGEAAFTTNDKFLLEKKYEAIIPQCEAHKATPFLFVGPDKHVIYPENLPENVEIADSRFVHGLLANAPCKALYPAKELIAHKSFHPTYLNRDTHWTTFGAILAANALSEALGSSHRIVIDEDSFTVSYDFGDLGKELGGQERINERVSLKFTSKAKLVWSNRLPFSCSMSIWENADKNLPTALCFGDSFFNAFLPVFASIFSRIVFVHAGGINFFNLSTFKEKFDFVISECVERNLQSFVKIQKPIYFLNTIKESILSGTYSGEHMKLFEGTLDSKNCPHDVVEKTALRGAIDFYQKNFKNNHVYNSPELMAELKKFNCLTTLTRDKKVGAIIMNCNPFTLGHRYLIDYARKKVDVLLVFVLQEDKSFFSFRDRFFLVVEGVSEFSNVFPFPSGKFIISSSTFKDYFGKDCSQDVTIDATNDLDIFSLFIAPKLQISTRFVGDEPFCKITNQYNEQMLALLPTRGIEVIRLDRFAIEEQAVSASYVRKLLQEKNREKLRTIVPESTYRFLADRDFRYSRQKENTNPEKPSDDVFDSILAIYGVLVAGNQKDQAEIVFNYINKICRQTEEKYLFAKKFAQKKFFSEASIFYSQILNDDDVSDKLLLSEVRSSYSDFLLSQGQLRQAVVQMQLALHVNPGNHVFMTQLANLFKKLEEFDSAEYYYKKAIEINSGVSASHVNYGMFLVEQGRNDEAIDAIKCALNLQQKNPSYYNFLGNIHRTKKEFDTATACYKTAIGINPNVASFHINYSHALVAQGKIQDAIEELLTCLTLEPDNAYFQQQLANLQK